MLPPSPYPIGWKKLEITLTFSKGEMIPKRRNASPLPYDAVVVEIRDNGTATMTFVPVGA
jgi:hypothetical protein